LVETDDGRKVVKSCHHEGEEKQCGDRGNFLFPNLFLLQLRAFFFMMSAIVLSNPLEMRATRYYCLPAHCRLNAENQSLIALYAPNDMPAVGATLSSIGAHPLNNPLNPSFFKVVFTTCIAPSYLQSHGV
jgi:hypothetical protein